MKYAYTTRWNWVCYHLSALLSHHDPKHTLHNIFWIIIADVVQQIICVMCSMRAQIHMENENISLLHISDISHGCCKFSTHYVVLVQYLYFFFLFQTSLNFWAFVARFSTNWDVSSLWFFPLYTTLICLGATNITRFRDCQQHKTQRNFMLFFCFSTSQFRRFLILI